MPFDDVLAHYWTTAKQDYANAQQTDSPSQPGPSCTTTNGQPNGAGRQPRAQGCSRNGTQWPGFDPTAQLPA